LAGGVGTGGIGYIGTDAAALEGTDWPAVFIQTMQPTDGGQGSR